MAAVVQSGQQIGSIEHLLSECDAVDIAGMNLCLASAHRKDHMKGFRRLQSPYASNLSPLQEDAAVRIQAVLRGRSGRKAAHEVAQRDLAVLRVHPKV